MMAGKLREPQTVGLSSEEASHRLAEFGPNAFVEAEGPSRVGEFFANFVQLFALLLWSGAALALVGGLPELAAAIVAVIVVNAIFAFAQEYRAEKAVAALRRILPLRVRVRRDGMPVEIASEGVVPGDLLLLAPGDRISADAEMVTAADLRVDQSALTGESNPVEPGEHVFAGTYVTGGTAEALVRTTGMATRFGQITELTQATRRERSPLERELDHLTRLVAVLAATIGVLFFFVAGVVGMGFSERFLFAIGVTVALVPEGLLPTMTFSLALATQRMAGRNALVRRLSSVETLGETTVICTDKTGTLTENEMTVQRIWTPECGEVAVEGVGYEPFGRFRAAGEVIDPAPLRELLRAGLLCNDARLVHVGAGWSIIGDPTEAALVAAAEKAGLRHEQEAARAPRLTELPFSSELKRMTTVHLAAGTQFACVKGAAEVILPRTTLSPEARAEASAAARAMETEALRVLAIARRLLPRDAVEGVGVIERELELLGLVGMLDPPRPEVPEAIRRCREAGIRTIMVTGDSGPTAEAIGRSVGLVAGAVHVITGAELAELDDAQLRGRLAERDVIFARIAPEQKLRLAQLLRADGEVVAMTGDGVNDAPALKHADIGIAMGRGGTEVAKEAADLILIDDNFASITAAVEEGRAVYDNIRRFAGYHLSSNVGELVPFLVWGASGGAIPLPLVVMQVLAIDLGTDIVPAIGLGTERAESGTMARRPRPRSERLLDRAVLRRVFGWVGPWVAVAGLASFVFAYVLAGWRPGESLADTGTLYLQATTMTMAGIVMAQIGAGLAWRSSLSSVVSIGFLSNRLLLIGIAVEVAMIAILAYTPGLDRAFHTSGLDVWHWLFLLVWPPIVLGAEEARKALLRRRAASDLSARAVGHQQRPPGDGTRRTA
jgi:P-type Ca2+ transporter type 2C